MISFAWLQCDVCGKKFSMDDIRYRCDNGACTGLLDFVYDYKSISGMIDWDRYPKTSMDVWKYHELLPIRDPSKRISMKEGGTPLLKLNRIGEELGCKELYAKIEGRNPTGSFKDRGMTVGVTRALELKQKAAACASTGNTAASLAAYSNRADLPCYVFMYESKVGGGKLDQIRFYGAHIINVNGGTDVKEGTFKDAFSAAIERVEAYCLKNKVYWLNSINPVRIEGQKTAAFEIAEQFDWDVPDRIILPVANGGNISSYYKGFDELVKVGKTESVPKMTGIQAEDVSPIVQAFKEHPDRIVRISKQPTTIARALHCGKPVSGRRALNAILRSRGYAEFVTDDEIMKAVLDLGKLEAIGCEPASATTLAGLRKLLEAGVVDRDERIVLIITGDMRNDLEAAEIIAKLKIMVKPETIQTMQPEEIPQAF